MLVGLMGYGQSGKDETGKILVRKGWTRVAFADPMKKAMHTMNPCVGDKRLADIVDEHGWEVAKQFPEVRRLLQVFGTEVGREQFGKDFWVDLSFDREIIPLINSGDHVVVTDVRFPNEIRRIRECGGSIWRIVRPHVGPINAHSSEAAWTKTKEDYRIINDGTLGELAENVEKGLDVCLMF